MRTVWVFLVCGIACVAQERDRLAARGFDHFYNLEYDDALACFARLAALSPGDPNVHNHLAQTILYRDMFRAGALETELVTGNNPFLRRPKVDASPADQKRFDQEIRTAIALARARLKANARDTQALYALGVSYGLRANYNFLVRKAWRDALRDATTARRMHNRVTDIDPSFVDARLVQGLHDYIVGSLPLHWRLLGFLVGFHGNKEDGLRALELVAAKGRLNRIEAEILLCAAYRREHNPRKAIPLLESLIPRFPRNYLLGLELAQMYSDSGDLTRALAALDRLERLKRAGRFPSLPLEKVLFARGNIQFWYNRLEDALANLKQAAAAAEDLDLNTGVLAWMRLGQIYDLEGQRPLALAAYRRAIAFAPDSDAARESRRYISSPYRRKQRS